MKKFWFVALFLISLVFAFPAWAEVKEILDTVAGETGATQTGLRFRHQANDQKALVQIEIASGDTVVIEGRLTSSLSFVIISTYTADTIDRVLLPSEYRARRTVDGAVGDSTVNVNDFK